MKALVLAVLMATSALAAEKNPEVRYDPNSPEALAAKAKYEEFERDGQGLQTADLYKDLVRLDAAKKSRIALAKPEEVMAVAFSTTDDDKRAISYATVLQRRSDAGDPYASFFYAVRQWDFCLQMQRQAGEIWAGQAKECWQKVMPAFKRASDAQIADATFNIARLYESGFGVTPSKLAAAEWYVKSADQYNRVKSRDEALTSVESALNLVPDHPAALRLRKAMLK
jgi:tetratricopeptide (TPR) repeat protein